MKFIDQFTRREYVRLMGLGLVSTQIPFMTYGFINNDKDKALIDEVFKVLSGETRRSRSLVFG